MTKFKIIVENMKTKEVVTEFFVKSWMDEDHLIRTLKLLVRGPS